MTLVQEAESDKKKNGLADEIIDLKIRSEENLNRLLLLFTGELDATKDSERTGNVESSLVDDAINLSVSSSGSESSSDDDTDAE